MSFPRPAETLPRTTTASAHLLRPHVRLSFRLGFAPRLPVTRALSAPTTDDSGYALCRHASVAAPFSQPPTRLPYGGGLLVLTVAASAVAISACFVFLSAIRSMLECKKAALSYEKSFISRREKLRETMASVRLFAREVSDLSMDLSDLSHELRKVVRSSMSIVHTVDAQLHQITRSAPQGTTERSPNSKKAVVGPLLSRTVKELRELIADIRSGYSAASSMVSFFMWASSFGPKRML